MKTSKSEMEKGGKVIQLFISMVGHLGAGRLREAVKAQDRLRDAGIEVSIGAMAHGAGDIEIVGNNLTAAEIVEALAEEAIEVVACEISEDAEISICKVTTEWVGDEVLVRAAFTGDVAGEAVMQIVDGELETTAMHLEGVNG